MLRKVTVRENERAFLIRHGRYVSVLDPGSHRVWDYAGRTVVEKHQIIKAELRPETATVFTKRRPLTANKLLQSVQTKEGEIAIVSFDGVPDHVLGPWSKRTYWKVVTNVKAEVINTTRASRVPKKLLNLVTAVPSEFVATAVISEHEAGLLFVDGEYKETLQSGRHAFWTVGRTIDIKILDMRPIPYEMRTQEILTKDRVSLQVSMSAQTRISDPKKALQSVPDYFSHIHRLLQQALREVITSRTLDQVLESRKEIDIEVTKYVKAHLGNIGVQVSELAINEMTLPGDMRNLINKVMEAEKDAEANRIRRNDGEAAARSLLDNAKLMNNNPFILRLKQIEVLEKLADKARQINSTDESDKQGIDRILDALLKFEDWHTENQPLENGNGNGKVKRLKRATN